MYVIPHADLPGFHHPSDQPIRLTRDHEYVLIGQRRSVPDPHALYPLMEDAVVHVEVPPVLIQGVGIAATQADACVASPMYQALQQDVAERGEVRITDRHAAPDTSVQREQLLESVMYRVTNIPGITHLIAADRRINPYQSSVLVERAQQHTGLTGLGAAMLLRIPDPHESPELKRLSVSDTYTF